MSNGVGFFLPWTMNEGRSDREAEDMQKVEFCSEPISSFII